MRFLVSLDDEVFHSLYLEPTQAEYIKGLLEAQIEKKEKERGSPLKNPPPERKRKKGEPPLPPLDDITKNLFGEEVQEKTKKKSTAPPYGQIYAIAKKEFPDFNFRTTTQKRNRKIARLWRANGKSIFVFEELFKMASASDFLNSRNGHSFRGKLSLTWIIDKAEDILDGKYDNERMSWALDKKPEMIDAVVVGIGRTRINPEHGKQIGECDVTGLPKYILTQDETNNDK
tara:strand:+ start:4352 stop:5041 length:690 start_codon:yes stop_codon:yes gene_type:complete